MSKNMTRKGIAFGAIAALGLSGLIATPAVAGEALYGQSDRTRVALEPTTGSTFAVMAVDDFELDSDLNGFTSQLPLEGSLKWKIENLSDTATDLASVDSAAEGVSVASIIADDVLDIRYSTGTTVEFDVVVRDGFNFNVSDVVNVTGFQTLTTSVGTSADGYSYDWTLDGSATVNDVDGNTLTLIDTTGVVETGLDGDLDGISTASTYQTPSTPADLDFTVALSSTAGHNDDVFVGEAGTDANGVDYRVVDSRMNGSVSDTRTLTLDNTGTDTKTVKVTAWADANNNDLIDSGEYASETETVTFVAAADVELAASGLSFTQPQLGTTSVVGSVITSPVLNLNQSSEVPGLRFSFQTGDTVDSSTVYAWADTYTFNATTGAFTATATSVSAVDPGNWAAVPFMMPRSSTTAYTNGSDTDATGTNATRIGTTSASTVVTAGYADGISATVAGTANTQPRTAKNGAAKTSLVRLGTESVAVTVAVTDALGNSVGAGREVQIDGYGTGYTVNGEAAPVTVLTDASGNAAFTVVKVDEDTAASQAFTFRVQDDNTSNLSSSTLSAALTLQWIAADYVLYNLNDNKLTDIEDNISINSGGNYTFTVGYHDQWRQPAPADEYRLKANNTGSTGSPVESILDLTPGGVSYSVVAGSTTTSTSFNTIFTAQKLTSGTWTDVSAGSDDGDQETVAFAVKSMTSGVVVESNAAARTANIQPLDAVEAFDSRATQAARDDYDEATSNKFATIEGRVVDPATNIARPYAVVTVSGDSRIMFTDDAISDAYAAVDRMGSITVIADANGDFTVHAYSNTSFVGGTTVSISSHGGSAVTTVEFNAPVSTHGKTVAVTQSDSVAPGSTIESTVVVTDQWGNPVPGATLTGTYTGPGVVSPSAASWPVNPLTDADGSYKALVFVGQNDKGTANWTWSTTRSATFFTPASEVIATSATTSIASYGEVSAWTKDMGDGTAKVYVKFPTIGDKVRIGHQTGGSGSYETIFVKTITSEGDSALVVNSNGSYIVRTIDLADINRIRVTVGDDVLVQVRYNQ